MGSRLLKFKEGDRVMYCKTGTAGNIVHIYVLDSKVWAELDSTGLLYEEGALEPAIIGGGPEKPREEDKAKPAKAEVNEVEIKDEGRIDTSGSVCGGG